MRLIVWKDSDTRHKYAYKLLRKFIQDMDLKTIKEVDCSIDESIKKLYGLHFTEVLFVGYGGAMEVVGKCPVEIQAGLRHIPFEKRHYCNPKEPNFDKAMTTNSLRFGKSTLSYGDGFTVNLPNNHRFKALETTHPALSEDNVDALRYAMPMKVKVNGEDTLVSIEDLEQAYDFKQRLRWE